MQQGAEGWWRNAHGRCLASDGCLASLVFTLDDGGPFSFEKILGSFLSLCKERRETGAGFARRSVDVVGTCGALGVGGGSGALAPSLLVIMVIGGAGHRRKRRRGHRHVLVVQLCQEL